MVENNPGPAALYKDKLYKGRKQITLKEQVYFISPSAEMGAHDQVEFNCRKQS